MHEILKIVDALFANYNIVKHVVVKNIIKYIAVTYDITRYVITKYNITKYSIVKYCRKIHDCEIKYCEIQYSETRPWNFSPISKMPYVYIQKYKIAYKSYKVQRLPSHLAILYYLYIYCCTDTIHTLWPECFLNKYLTKLSYSQKEAY